ncbi:MAG: Dabb family protein [Verrucomicrobiota bacterium]
MITHVVIFWTDKPHEENKMKLLDAAEKLASIPGVQNFRIGGPVRSLRGAVDDSFSVAISLDLANPEAVKNYLEHPIHSEFINGAFKEYCKRYVVYDFGE